MIIVDQDSFQKSSSGLICANISIKVEGKFFPEEKWSDSIVILSWWTDQLVPFFSGLSEVGELIFMEGPFRVNFKRFGKNVNVTFLVSQLITETFDVDFDTLRTSALNGMTSAMAQSLITCAKNGWRTNDVHLLKESYNTINRTFHLS